MIFDFLQRLTLLRRCLICFFSGGAMALAMPPFGFWPMLFFGIGTFYLCLIGQKRWPAFFTGWAFGFGYFLAGLFWIANALLVPGNPFKWVWPLAILGLPVGLALFTGVAAWLSTLIARPETKRGMLAFIVCLGGSEFLRGHIFTGFPWNLYAYGWAKSPALSQVVSLVGAYGLSVLTIVICCVPAWILASHADRKTASITFLVLITVLNAWFMWGTERIRNNPAQFHDSVTIRIVQPNIAQEDKWNEEKLGQNLTSMIGHSTAPADSPEKTIIVWPETSISDFITSDPSGAQFLKQSLFDRLPGALLATGMLRHQTNRITGENQYYNSLVVLNSSLENLAVFDKTHLVPFGEYIPFKDIIPLTPFVAFSGFTPGSGLQTLTADKIPSFSPLVCYEIIFPGNVTDKNNRPEWIINVTNDGWYGDSPGPYQHMTMAIFRAIEEGIPVARSANTGVSVMIDPVGRVLKKIPYGAAGHFDTALPKRLENTTIYSRYGDTPLILFFVFALCALWMSRKQPRN